MAITADNNLRKGSKGEDVLALQKALNAVGYSLDEDSSFGAKTEAAVRDYQSKNGLTVDGVVGTHTWGSLTNNQPSAAANIETPTMNTAPASAYSANVDALLQKVMNPTPVASNPVQDTYNAKVNDLLNQALSIDMTAKGAGEQAYDDNISALLDKALNRGEFAYDYKNDPIYQQYAEQYMLNGQRAAKDVAAQSAALSGGYGNSYGNTASNLAYQQYLQQINNVLPTLEQNAYNRYNQQNSDILNLISTLQGARASDLSAKAQQAQNYAMPYDILQTAYSNALANQNTQQQTQNAALQYALSQLGAVQDTRSTELSQQAQELANQLAQLELDNYQSGGGTSSSSGGSSKSSSSSNKRKLNETDSKTYAKKYAALLKEGNKVQAESFLSVEESKGFLTEADHDYIVSLANSAKISPTSTDTTWAKTYSASFYI